eukprot:jgi/Mesvir1/15063/Mv14713-RA.1
MERNRAYVTLVMMGDNYVGGALVLAGTLREVGAQADLVIMITEDVSNAARAALAKLYDKVIVVPYIRARAHQKYQPRFTERYGRWLDSCFTKFNFFGLTQYSKIVWIEADCLALSNPDELFQLHAPAGICSNFLWEEDARWHGQRVPQALVARSISDSVTAPPLATPSPPQRAPVDTFKTVICPKFANGLFCARGARCTDAHGQHELRQVAPPDATTCPSPGPAVSNGPPPGLGRAGSAQGHGHGSGSGAKDGYSSHHGVSPTGDKGWQSSPSGGQGRRASGPGQPSSHDGSPHQQQQQQQQSPQQQGNSHAQRHMPYGVRGCLAVLEPDMRVLGEIKGMLAARGEYGEKRLVVGPDELLLTTLFMDRWTHIATRFACPSWKTSEMVTRCNRPPVILHYVSDKPWWVKERVNQNTPEQENWPDFDIWRQAGDRLLQVHPEFRPFLATKV